jgi:gliding motility-associated-like protein
MQVKNLIYIGLMMLMIANGYGQTPSTCFEIESILVDACGTPEGENEMVRFTVGPNPLNTATLNVNWPNNSWLGACQNAITAGNVAQLNTSITACGFLLEPPGGLIPAGASVILVTSTNFSAVANSFAGLSDTIYIIFQCQGNTTGHFANATGTGLRTLTMDFSGCSDNVSYSCQLLEDVFGNTGTAGASTDRDGAVVIYDWAGNADYLNFGCSAPYIPLIVNAGNDQPACMGDTINLNGWVNGNYVSVNWTGGSGTWIIDDQLNAQYIVGANDFSSGFLVMNVQTCNGNVSDTLQILATSPPAINSHTEYFTICDNENVVLDAGPGGPFIWSTGATGSTITVGIEGTYFVNAVNSCGALSDTVFFYLDEVDVVAGFMVDSLSGNSPLEVQFTNQSQDASLYSWIFGTEGSSAEANPSFTFIHPGDHLVLLNASNGNCNDTASIIIHVNSCESFIYIPNSFTPNLDEINPEFFISSTCSYRSVITIFDRWGREIYSWTDVGQGWDGTHSSGALMPQGVYVYLFESEDLNGVRTIYRGHLNLLR